VIGAAIEAHVRPFDLDAEEALVGEGALPHGHGIGCRDEAEGGD
jgi:hypothetical protein